MVKLSQISGKVIVYCDTASHLRHLRHVCLTK